MDDPNVNPAWDALLGHETNGAVARLLLLVAAFVLAGGTFFWLID